MFPSIYSPEPQPDDIYFVDPLDVVVGMTKSKEWPTEEQILEMAMSLYTHGQRLPVECYKNSDSTYQVKHGIKRTAAAWLIRSGFMHKDEKTGENVKIKVRTFKLKVVICEGDEAQHITQVMKSNTVMALLPKKKAGRKAIWTQQAC